MGFPEHIGVAGSHQHDEGDEAHHLYAAIHHFIHLVPFDGAGGQHHQEAAHGTDGQGFEVQLGHESNHCTAQGFPAVRVHFGFSSLFILAHDGQILVFPVTAVENGGKDQAHQHGGAADPHNRGNVTDGNLHVVGHHLILDDGHEQQPEPNRKGNIRCFQPEGQCAGHGSPVQFHVVHHNQQRGNQDRDECDVHRDQVLGEAGHESDQEYEGRFFGAHNLGDFPCCDVCHTGPSDGDCQGPQQDVAQSRF